MQTVAPQQSLPPVNACTESCAGVSDGGLKAAKHGGSGETGKSFRETLSGRMGESDRSSDQLMHGSPGGKALPLADEAETLHRPDHPQQLDQDDVIAGQALPPQPVVADAGSRIRKVLSAADMPADSGEPPQLAGIDDADLIRLAGNLRTESGITTTVAKAQVTASGNAQQLLPNREPEAFTMRLNENPGTDADRQTADMLSGSSRVSGIDLALQRINTENTPAQAQLHYLNSTADAQQSAPRLLNMPILQTTDAVLQSTSAAGTYTQVAEAFDSPEWGQGFNRQVVWLLSQNIRAAEIRLNPANLGPIEVQIEVNDDQVNVNFSSRVAGVREAVEMAMPRLREMLNESGLNLADSNVSDQSLPRQYSDNQHTRSQGAFNEPLAGTDIIPDSDLLPDTPTRPGHVIHALAGRLDLYI